MNIALRRFCAWLLLWGLAAPAAAHEARPVALNIHDRGGNNYVFELRVPTSIPPDNQPSLEWPADCRVAGTQSLRCGQPLAGRSVRLQWPLYNPSVTTLARYMPQQGATRTAVLPPSANA